MMQKRTLYSLLLISFMVVFSASVSLANQIVFQSKNASRCTSTPVNVTATVSSDSVSAVEIVAIVTGNFTGVPSVTFDAGFTELDNRGVDATQANGVSPDTLRIWALRTDPGDATLKAGTKVIARINLNVANACTGTITIENGVFVYPNPVGTVTTQFVNAANAAILPVAVTTGVVTLVNSAPSLASIPDATLPWGTMYSGTATATDPDVAGCEKLSYSKVSGPGALTVNANTGAISWLTTGNDVCTHQVIVQVSDSCGATDRDTFNICVTNQAPTVTCPPKQTMGVDETINTPPVTGTDPDNGPRPLIYNLVSTDFPGDVTVNAATGVVTLKSTANKGDVGVYQVCVSASDSANVCNPCSPSNADTCCFLVEVIGMSIAIECEDGAGLGVLQGEYTLVDVTVDDFNYPMAGFDLLIQYDASALNLATVLEGQFIADCDWEYFQFRYGQNGNCGSGVCPSGHVRIVGLARSNTGLPWNGCYVNDNTTSGVLAQLKFLVSNDRTLECLSVPVNFIWYDCGDNAISTVSGDTTFISRRVYSSNGTQINILGQGFPTGFGAQDECDLINPGKPIPLRNADFTNGCVKIICAEDIDARGDVNLNNLAYEIGDAVVFTNYFIEGIGAFNINVAGQTAATDVNADGSVLTVADLVYLIRVIVGDANPFPKLDVVNVHYTLERGVMSVDGADMGAAHLVIAGNVTPTLLADNMEMKYAFDGTNTRVIIYPQFEGVNLDGLQSFTGDFIGFEGEVISLEMATIQGATVAVKLVPKSFSVSQNYPNPFNPKTNIRLALPQAGDYNLAIYNIQGQMVHEVNGNASEAGFITVEWDASNLASGVYFYRVTSGKYSDVKKAVLLK